MRQRDREPLGGYGHDDPYSGPASGYGRAGGYVGQHSRGSEQSPYDRDEHGHDGHDDHDDGGSLLDDYDSTEADEGRIPRMRRAAHRLDHFHSHGDRHGPNRRLIVLFSGLFVALLVAVASWYVVDHHVFGSADYSGSGTGSVIVTVHPDDGAQQIGETLQAKGVVASVGAFTDAAKADPQSQNIQPGSYRLHHHMSANSALQLLLDPAARVNGGILVPEGATIRDVEKRLSLPACTDTAKPSGSCGLGLKHAQVVRVMRNVASLGLPRDYLVNGKQPQSVEGFLFPATYPLPPKASASDALTAMISEFVNQARSIDFTSSAKALHLTPYQELIIASIAQSEAKYASDFPKVARVILNRLQKHIPLRIDATSAYAAKLKGLDPTKIIYATINSPFNTYTHDGLPPTPVGNPGIDAMKGAASPASGNWLFYVNADAQGHLGFYSTEQQFVAAVDKCRANHWGCG